MSSTSPQLYRSWAAGIPRITQINLTQYKWFGTQTETVPLYRATLTVALYKKGNMGWSCSPKRSLGTYSCLWLKLASEQNAMWMKRAGISTFCNREMCVVSFNNSWRPDTLYDPRTIQTKFKLEQKGELCWFISLYGFYSFC